MDGNKKAAKMLLLLGADGKQKSRDGNTALTFSIAFNHGKFSEFILPYSDINSRDEDDDTALMFAAWRDQDALVSEMIAYGADVNSRSRHGSTALWNAVYRSSRDSVLVLLQNNADMGIRCEGTHLFLTPTDSMEEGEIKKIYPGHRRSLLWVAAEMAMNVKTRAKSLAIISLLLQAGYDVTGDHWIKRIRDPNVSSSDVPMRFRDDNSLARLLMYFYNRPLQLRDICRNKLRKLHQSCTLRHRVPYAQWVSEAGLGNRCLRDFVCLLYLDDT
ncbi:unnamed protein product [Lymnaea stagnalis]|uniref:Ankyrin repeat protein n=1 Tax=Lymnaea stagnalis TaxID=6523 RepID=A0AAV2H2E2_LYMST